MPDHPDRQALLSQSLQALEGIYAWYGRQRIAPYPHEPVAWQKVRTAIADIRAVMDPVQHHQDLQSHE